MGSEKVDEEEMVAQLRREVAKLKAETKELKALATKSLQDGKHVKWSKLSEKWQNDRDFIVAAIRGDRVDWHTLPAQWKADFAVACASVLSKTPRNTEPVLWRDFPESLRDFATENQPAFVLEALNNDRMKWDDVPDSLKYHNRDISLFGVNNNHVQTEDCPCLDDRNTSRDGGKEKQQAHSQDSKEDSQCNNEEHEVCVDTTKVSNGEKQQQAHPKDNDTGTHTLSGKELAAYKAVDKGYTSYEEQRALAAKRQPRPTRHVSKSLINTTSLQERMAALKAGKQKQEVALNKTVVEESVPGPSAGPLPKVAVSEVQVEKEQQSDEHNIESADDQKAAEEVLQCSKVPEEVEDNMEDDDEDSVCSKDSDENVLTVQKVRNQDNDSETPTMSEKELAAYKAVDKGYTSFEEQRALAAKRQPRPARHVSKSLKNTTSLQERMAAFKAGKKK